MPDSIHRVEEKINERLEFLQLQRDELLIELQAKLEELAEAVHYSVSLSSTVGDIYCGIEELTELVEKRERVKEKIFNTKILLYTVKEEIENGLKEGGG